MLCENCFKKQNLFDQIYNILIPVFYGITPREILCYNCSAARILDCVIVIYTFDTCNIAMGILRIIFDVPKLLRWQIEFTQDKAREAKINFEN